MVGIVSKAARRLSKAEKFNALLCANDELDREYNKGLLRAIKCVKRAPAVDAEPARRGEWTKPYKNDIWDCYACSLCGYICDSKFRFCPNCDAKMDRGAEK